MMCLRIPRLILMTLKVRSLKKYCDFEPSVLHRSQGEMQDSEELSSSSGSFGCCSVAVFIYQCRNAPLIHEDYLLLITLSCTIVPHHFRRNQRDGYTLSISSATCWSIRWRQLERRRRFSYRQKIYGDGVLEKESLVDRRDAIEYRQESNGTTRRDAGRFEDLRIRLL